MRSHTAGVTLLILALAAWPGAGVARVWDVPGDAPTIQAGVDSAQAGDEVRIRHGEYDEHDIAVDKAIHVRSVDGAGVTLVDAGRAGSGFLVEDIDGTCIIEGLGIRLGRAGSASYGYGGGVYVRNATFTMRACTIVDCEASDGGGLVAFDSSVLLEDCRIESNEAGVGGGVLASPYDTGFSRLVMRRCEVLANDAFPGLCCASGGGVLAIGEVQLLDCVLAGNRTGYYGAGAALGVSGDAVVSGCTIAGNEGLWDPEDSIIEVFSGRLRLERTILAFNTGRPMSCSFQSNVTVTCSNLFANTAGDAFCGTDGGDNFSADPEFCDAEAGEYDLFGSSPCLPGQHPDGADCGRVGALGMGCGRTPTETSSWSGLKGRYRPSAASTRGVDFPVGSGE